jgi:ABC-type proline/glycine betaine transport system substrate-binding protein
MHLPILLLETTTVDWLGGLVQVIDKYGKDFAELVVVIAAFVKGWVVPRYVHDDIKEQRDRAIGAVENALTSAETAVKLADAATEARRRERRT